MATFSTYATLIPLMLLACTNKFASEHPKVVVMDYNDFGPQAMAHELIGMEWWQWQAHGGSRPEQYPIRVVVYSDISQAEVSQQYPVRPEQQQDYRYLEYPKAREYLRQAIEENAITSVTTRLKKTLQQLQQVFAHRSSQAKD